MSKTPRQLGEEVAEMLLRPIEDAFLSEGITPEYLAEKLKQELEYGGKKPKPVQMAIRQRARQDAHKVRGDYSAEKHEHDHKGNITVIEPKAVKAPERDED